MMMKTGFGLVAAAILLSLGSTFLFEDSDYTKYIQAASFLLFVAGLFLIERKKVKERHEQRKKKSR